MPQIVEHLNRKPMDPSSNASITKKKKKRKAIDLNVGIILKLCMCFLPVATMGGHT
jgi:hypothetical protein